MAKFNKAKLPELPKKEPPTPSFAEVVEATLYKLLPSLIEESVSKALPVALKDAVSKASSSPKDMSLEELEAELGELEKEELEEVSKAQDDYTPEKSEEELAEEAAEKEEEPEEDDEKAQEIDHSGVLSDHEVEDLGDYSDPFEGIDEGEEVEEVEKALKGGAYKGKGKRIDKGGGKFTYVYDTPKGKGSRYRSGTPKIPHHKLADHSNYKAGAKFSAGKDKGNFHIKDDKGGSLTVHHDHTGETSKMSKKEFQKKLTGAHSEAVKSHFDEGMGNRLENAKAHHEKDPKSNDSQRSREELDRMIGYGAKHGLSSKHSMEASSLLDEHKETIPKKSLPDHLEGTLKSQPPLTESTHGEVLSKVREVGAELGKKGRPSPEKLKQMEKGITEAMTAIKQEFKGLHDKSFEKDYKDRARNVMSSLRFLRERVRGMSGHSDLTSEHFRKQARDHAGKLGVSLGKHGPEKGKNVGVREFVGAGG